MNLNGEQIERIKGLGYTDAEARFIYIVAIHSGYFTQRQFLNFAQATRGKRSNAFAQKLLKHGHATMRDYMGAGPIFHLFSRTIYGQIEKDNLRNRRQHSFEFIRTRLVLLDFVLANQDLAYFETEQDKVHFFGEKLGVSKDFLPAKVYEGVSSSRPTIRYFVDKFPLFLAPPLPTLPPVVTLSFVDSGFESPSSFPGHVNAYQALFQHLRTFRFLYIAPKETHFRTAENRFRALVKRPLESDVSSEVLRYFQVRRKWDNREYVVPVTDDFEFLNDARRRFHGERFESQYEAWRTGELKEHDLRREFSQLTPDRSVFFDTYLVKGHTCPVAVDSGPGERSLKDGVHPPVHRSVHPEGERKLVRA